MKTKILIPTLIVGSIGVIAATGSYAATSIPSTGARTMTQSGLAFGLVNYNHGKKGGMMGEKEMLGGNLTDAEKTALNAMTDAQKKEFFDKKRAEMEAQHDAHEAVIDKLLAGQTLTTEEEALRQTIIKNRAEMKAKRAEMEAQRAKIETIRQKQQSGQTLTSEEQQLLDSMPQRGKRGEHPRLSTTQNIDSAQAPTNNK